MDHLPYVARLAQDLVRLDSRSARPNGAVADRLAAELTGFELERLPYEDQAGTEKCVLVAARGRGGLALSGHMDTVPDTGWQDDPWSGRIEGDVLHGLGSTDMKGPLAAIVAAVRALPESVPVALLITTDEETTKQGARLAAGSALARHFAPRGILVAEPTGMIPVRGHRSNVTFTATATGTQAHSSTGQGRNANWDLVDFLSDMRALHHRLRTESSLLDAGYDPPFSDFNPVIDNHGAAVNVTVPRATVRIKFRYSRSIDPSPVIQAVRDAASRAGLALSEAVEAQPPELPESHPLVQLAVGQTGQAPRTAPYGTDAVDLQALAPCVVLGPGDIAQAHTPTERASLSALAAAVPVFAALAQRLAA